MEVLSGVSSVVALVSLVIQPGDDIKKLGDFWQSMGGASKDIELIIGDLSILANITESIGKKQSPRDHIHDRSIPVSKPLSNVVRALTS